MKRSDRKKPQSPTIDDVAALAGVGRATVSRVLNDKPHVREEIRDTVMNAVRKLDYKVNRQARALANGKRYNLAIVFSSSTSAEPNSYYQSGVELGALRASIRAGFQLSTIHVLEDADDKSAGILKAIESEGCGGIILTPPLSDDVRLVQTIIDRGCPAVCISPGDRTSPLVQGIGIDDERAGFDMGEYVVGLHHERIAFIDAPVQHHSAQRRIEGFSRALEQNGIDPGTLRRVRGDFTFRAGAELTDELLAVEYPPSIIVCANDDMAVGAMFAAHKQGLDVPEDLSVVGFDDTPISAHIWPPLTTVHQPLQAIGQRAAELLIANIESTEAEASPSRETIPHRIVIRESAAGQKSAHVKDRATKIGSASRSI